MAAKRPTSSSAEVTPTEAEPNDGTVATTADPTLAAPDSSVAPAPAPVAAEPAPVVAETAPVAPVAPAQQVVYVEAPKPFIEKGNRGFGILIALLSTVIFAALLAVSYVIADLINGLSVDFSFLSTRDFYAPVVMFAVGFILLVLIVNRAGWAAHVLGSIFVGLVTFFGGTGLVLLLHISEIPSNEVGQTYTSVLFTSGLIISGLLGREVSLWMGFAIASRGRRVKARNVDAKVLYDQEIAAKRAEYEQANAAAGVPAAPVAEAPAAPVADAPVAADEVPADTVAP